MIYKLELNDLPFEAIKSGRKKIETRTKVPHNMTSYEEMKKGDQILFTKASSGEEMMVEILGVRHYKDVESLLDEEGQENVMSYETSRDEAVKSWNKLTGYTEGIKKYGIWGIEVRVLD